MFTKTLQSLILITFAACDVMTIVQSGGHLYQRAGVGVWLARPSESWLYRSRTECVRACVRLGGQCGAVEFDQLSGNCAVGGMVVKRSDGPAPPQPPQPSAVFYSRRGMCDSAPGFSYVAHYDTQICLHVSDQKVKWDEATEICRQRGARLYVMKSMEKYHILEQNRKNEESIWIGLKDTTGNKTFHWIDDGEPFEASNPLWDFFWRRGQPSFNLSYQNCVTVYGDSMKYFDASCGMNKIFACEMDLP